MESESETNKRTVFIPLKRLQDWWRKGKEYCDSKQIVFHTTPLLPQTVEETQEKLWLPFKNITYRQRFNLSKVKSYTEKGFEPEMNAQLQHMFDLFNYILTDEGETPLLRVCKDIFNTYGVRFSVGCIVDKSSEPKDFAEIGYIPDKNIHVYMPGSKQAYNARMRGLNVSLRVDYGAFTHSKDKREFIYTPTPPEVFATVWQHVYGAKLGIPADEVPLPPAGFGKRSLCSAKRQVKPSNPTSVMDWAGKTHRRLLRAQACLKPADDPSVSLTNVVDMCIGYFTPHRMFETSMLKRMFDMAQSSPARTTRGKLAMLHHILSKNGIPESELPKYVTVSENGDVAYTDEGKALLQSSRHLLFRAGAVTR